MLMLLPFTRSFPRLAPTTRAALWMLVGGFCAVMMNVLIRLAAQRMHPFEVTFFRCLFSLFVMLPFIIRAGPAVLVNRKVGFYPLRAVGGLVSLLSWRSGITFMPVP